MFLHKDDEGFIQKAKALGYPAAGYNYKNTTLISLLEITKEEQKHLRTIISAEEKERRRTKKRHTEGRADRRNGQAPSVCRETYFAECVDAIADNIIRAKELKAQGVSQRAIAKELGISVSTVNGYLKK